MKIDEEYFDELLKSRPFHKTYSNYKKLLNMDKTANCKAKVKPGDVVQTFAGEVKVGIVVDLTIVEKHTGLEMDRMKYVYVNIDGTIKALNPDLVDRLAEKHRPKEICNKCGSPLKEIFLFTSSAKGCPNCG
jgi:hypothetical protein